MGTRFNKVTVTGERQDGELPKGRAWTTFGEIISSISNGLSVRQRKDEKGTPVTLIETISKGTFDLMRVG